ncbi:MAG: hypothetical protein HLUCCO02_12125 [Idiomarinaceae bacterium HL-53]|nr:MAG: hypothetical protein HLUCCO02_12125 [Idiomarinaceae bacterium HL-53]CUS49388.1 hypothetical protein Ga0003345_2381 [Idiomarinaceae bacterium HL-53]
MSFTFLEFIWVLAIGVGFTSVLIVQRVEYTPEVAVKYCQIDQETYQRLRDEAFLFGQSEVNVEKSMHCDQES